VSRAQVMTALGREYDDWSWQVVRDRSDSATWRIELDGAARYVKVASGAAARFLEAEATRTP